ncbi:3806_t:CDS:1, partial [Cetraspora pellucida]
DLNTPNIRIEEGYTDDADSDIDQQAANLGASVENIEIMALRDRVQHTRRNNSREPS